MKASVFFIIGSLVVIWSGCDKSTGPSLVPTSGTITINSKFVNNQTTGFSFSQASSVSFPNSQGILPDVMVLVQIDAGGSILGVYLSAPDFPRPTFRLLRQYNVLDSAVVFYQSLSQLPDTTYTDLAIPTRVNQVWAVKTRENKFAKILVRNIIAYADSSTTNAPTPFGEATFDWTFQPNGTRQF